MRIWNFSKRPEVPVALVCRTVGTLHLPPPFDDDQAMIKILSITYLEGTTFVGEGHQIRLAARPAERPPGRWSGLFFDGRLVLQGSHLVLLPSRVRRELVHKLKITFSLSTCIGRCASQAF